MLVCRGLGFIVAAALANAACGRTGGGSVQSRDSGTPLADPPADGSSPSPDASADTRVARADEPAPRDGVILEPDVGSDLAGSGLGDANADTKLAERDFGPDDRSADAEKAIPADAGPDGVSVRPEVAFDGAVDDAAGVLACKQGSPFGGVSLMNGADSPDFLALGDLNGDGRLDIVTGSRARAWDTVSVLLGEGRGTFSARTDYYAGFQLTSLALGDVDADGNLDILTTSQDTNAIAVLLGKGDGTFPGPPVYASGPALSSVAMGDLNADGTPDLVAVAWPGGGAFGSLSVMIGVGDGTFPTRVDYVCGDNPSEPALADVDGDGKLDVVVANSGRDTASVLFGHGDGAFAAPLVFPAGAGANAAFLRPLVEDLDGDGKMDVVVTSVGFGPKVLLGKGGGQFSAPWDPGLVALGAATWVALGDVNGDGKKDFLARSSSTLVVYLGNGVATFAPGIVSAVGANVSGSALGDLDGDGVPDLALGLSRGGSDGSLAVLRGNGNGGFGPGIWHSTEKAASSGTLADLDGDGNLDLVSLGGDSIGVALGYGDGAFAAETEYKTGDRPIALALADLDGDGRLDVVTANNNAGGVSVLLGTGAGKLAVKADYATVEGPAGLVLGDLNGDGRLDLVAFNSSIVSAGRVDVMFGIGGGKLAVGATYSVGYAPRAAALGDVNGDGTQDLVVVLGGYGGSYPSVDVLLGKGDGSLAAGMDDAIDSRIVPSSIVLSDLNGDGKLDMILGSSASVSVSLGKGDGTFSAQVDYPAAGGGGAMGDIDGDGKLDIVTGASVLFGAGNGTFPSRMDYLSGNRWFAIGDLNRDGKPDLVAGLPGGMSVLLNACR